MLARRQASLAGDGANQASSDVCVIIPAHNSAATIGRAIGSALRQPEVAEIVVVDDCSTDDTVAIARSADDGSGRLKVLESAQNAGPAAARNRGIAESRSKFIALLDADDYFLDHRFRGLLDGDDWDVIGDDICFVAENGDLPPPSASAGRDRGWTRRSLGLAGFIDRNIPVPGRPRRELGFIKPVIRRRILEDLKIAYDPALRLGEDYVFYATLLARGARFLCVSSCGYVAVERAGSLSGAHATRDLENLLAANRRLAQSERLDRDSGEILARHLHNLERRVHHRRVLDRKRENLIGALALVAKRPGLLPGLIRDIVRDKRRAGAAPVREVSYLFD